MANLKLLLTGATGYIGGSVLNQFITSSNSKIRNLSISVLVRKPEHAEYYKSQGITPILFDSLDQVDLLKEAASQHDIVVNTASAFQHRAAEVMIQGLAERKKTSSQPVYYIHTSGTSSIANRPVTKLYIDADEPREFSDKDDVIGYELEREKIEQYGQRTTDLAVVAAGESTGVPTYILMSPTIYGKGTGAFNQLSIQIPFLMRLAMKKGYAEYISDGAGVWDHAHVLDTAALYEVILEKLLNGENLPSGRKGLYFASNGRSSWKEVSEHVAKAGYKLGVLKDDFARSGDLEEMTEHNPSKSVQYVELGTASRSVTNADLSRELGWSPKYGEADWEAHFLEAFEDVVKGSKA